MDADYDNTNSVVSQTLSWAAVSLNTDGSLKAGSVGQSQLVSGLFDDIAQDIIDEVQPLVDQAFAPVLAVLRPTERRALTAILRKVVSETESVNAPRARGAPSRARRLRRRGRASAVRG